MYHVCDGHQISEHITDEHETWIFGVQISFSIQTPDLGTNSSQ